MSKNNDNTTGNLLDYEYFKYHYQLIAVDLSKQIELENPDLKQQITFIGRLGENNAKMFFIIDKKAETTEITGDIKVAGVTANIMLHLKILLLFQDV